MDRGKLQFWFLIALLAGVLGLRARDAGEPIKFAHLAHIANDGRIAFTYHDDVWIADADGSNGHRLTAHVANDFSPRFSPDGKWVAFTSNRSGNNDVYLVPSAGGEPRQLTYYSGDDQALYWTPDGKSIIISSNRGPNAYGSPLYQLPIDGSVPVPLGMGTARLGMMKQDGTQIAYNRALPSTGIWRKSFRGNSAPGITVMDIKTGEIADITNTDMRNYRTHVNDVYPMWAADGMIYFASERDGTYNIWKITPKGANAQQVTHFKEGGVFNPSISPDGKKIIFQNDFDLYTLDLPNGNPKKISIPLAFDPKESDVEVLTSDSRADGFGPSPNGEYVAVEFHGNVEIVPSEQGIGEKTPVAISSWRETSAKYSPDGKKIAYISDESGDQEVWIYELASGVRQRLSSQPSEKANLVWSADSQKLCYTGNNRIWEIDFANGQPQPLELANNVAGGFNIQQYSADGTWLVYSRRDEDQNSEIYLYDIRGKKEYNITQNPNSESSAALTPDGKTVVFTSNRDGAMNHLFAVSLSRLTEDPNDPLVRERIRRATAASGGRGGRGGGGTSGDVAGSAPAASPPGPIDLNGIEKRAIQLTRGSSPVSGFFLSTDGRTIYYVIGGGGGGRGGAPTPAPGRGAAAAAGAESQNTGLFAMGIDGRDGRRIASGSFPGMMPTADRRAIFFRAAAARTAADEPAGRGAGPQGQEVHRIVLASPQREDRVTFSLEFQSTAMPSGNRCSKKHGGS